MSASAETSPHTIAHSASSHPSPQYVAITTTRAPNKTYTILPRQQRTWQRPHCIQPYKALRTKLRSDPLQTTTLANKLPKTLHAEVTNASPLDVPSRILPPDTGRCLNSMPEAFYKTPETHPPLMIHAAQRVYAEPRPCNSPTTHAYTRFGTTTVSTNPYTKQTLARPKVRTAAAWNWQNGASVSASPHWTLRSPLLPLMKV